MTLYQKKTVRRIAKCIFLKNAGFLTIFLTIFTAGKVQTDRLKNSEILSMNSMNLIYEFPADCHSPGFMLY